MPAAADLILANRAYLDHNTSPGGGPPPPVGSGGLLVAVSPTITRDGSTTWIGAGRGSHDREWTDADGREQLDIPGGGVLAHHRLYFDDATWAGHYDVTANGFFWPLFHLVRAPLPRVTSYFPEPETPAPADWSAFRAVNDAFARAALEDGRNVSCWVHDYQLGLVPSLVRAGGYPGAIGFFLHTPFPRLAVAREYLSGAGAGHFADWVTGVLGADLVGLQTPADAERFREAAVELGLASLDGDGLRVDGRRVVVRDFPVGIDFDDTAAMGAAGQPPAIVRESGWQPPLVVGLERADYTKGIPERLQAIAELYREGLAFSYVGIASPTRETVAAYQRLQAETARLVEEVRGVAPPGVLFECTAMALPFGEVLGLLGAADVVCTSSLADGMNLVPLQAVAVQAARPEAQRGVVLTGMDAGVASAFAGFERDGLVPFDPLDHDAFTHVLRQAVRGALPGISGRLIDAVRSGDATAWGRRYLEALETAHAQR